VGSHYVQSNSRESCNRSRITRSESSAALAETSSFLLFVILRPPSIVVVLKMARWQDVDENEGCEM
jgi:hypothetical protein